MLAAQQGIKVANIILDGRLGGPQYRITRVAKRLIPLGITTVVILPKKESTDFMKLLRDSGLQAIQIKIHRLSRQIFSLITYLVRFLPELWNLRNLLKKERIDIVHCNSIYQIKSVVAGKLSGVKVILHINDAATPKLFKLLSPLLIRLADGIIFAGHRIQNPTFPQEDQNISPKTCTIIQAPVETDIFDPSLVSAYSELPNPKNIKIVSVGSVNPAKGLEYFLRMAAMLNVAHKNVSFYIAGAHLSSQSGYSRTLREFMEQNGLHNVHFLGHIEDIRGLLKAADIYVCSSIAEASPTAVWEAMSMGKAIVASNVGDVSRFLKDGVDGFIVPPRDAQSLADKVDSLIQNKSLRTDFGARVRPIAIREFGIETCVERHKSIYLEVLAK